MRLIVRIELPGVAAEQIEIGLTSSQLRVWGEKEAARRPRANHLTSVLRA